jgi:cellulose 1,4-beta-cellobiosidase
VASVVFLTIPRLTFESNESTDIGSRVYLMANSTEYQTFNLFNKEIAFDIDVSTLDCGYSSGLYFVAMDADGSSAKHPVNAAGAKYGTGYCDASCPRDVKWINGEVMHTLLRTKIQAITNSLPRQTSRNGPLH